MPNWKFPIIAIATFALSSLWMAASAQAQHASNPSAYSQVPLAPVPKTAPQAPVGQSGHKMAPPPVEVFRLKPLRSFVRLYGHKPFIAETAEGMLSYKFDEQGQLTMEVLGNYGNYIRGRYFYDRHGRFERIEYSDGVVITSRYSDNGKLSALYSDDGRGIGFTYRVGKDGYLGDVSPNSYEFHSAVALLRLKEIPAWWRDAVQPSAENVDEGDEGKTSLPEYHGNPFPNAPRTPGPDGDPLPTIPVSGERPDPGPPDTPDGIDLIPIGGNSGGNDPGGDSGGNGRGGGGVGPVGEIKDAIDLARREVMIAQCRSKCSATGQTLSDKCSSGPRPRDRYLCGAKVVNFEEKCKINCDLCDFTWEWIKREPPINYFPWEEDGAVPI